jgi:hypothetical protein
MLVLLGVRRDNPGREVTLTIQRGLDTKPFPLPVTPDLAPRDDGGVIGVKLGANAKVCTKCSWCTGLLYLWQQQRGCSSADRCEGCSTYGAASLCCGTCYGPGLVCVGSCHRSHLMLTVCHSGLAGGAQLC